MTSSLSNALDEKVVVAGVLVWWYIFFHSNMSNTTIKEAASLDGGEFIPQMQFVIKQAYEPKSGTNDNGDWKLQSAMVQDDTGSIRATFFDFDQDIRNLKGNEVIVKSGKDGKGHPSGIETYDYEDKKKNTITRQITIKRFATITEAIGGEPVYTGPANSQRPEQPVRQSVPNREVPVCVERERMSFEKQAALKAAMDFAALDKSGIVTAAQIVDAANTIYNDFFVGKPKTEEKPQSEAQPSEEKVI